MSLTIEQFVKTGFRCAKPSPSSQKNYQVHISQFEDFLKKRDKTAQDGTVADEDILEYVEHLKSKYRPNTIATKVAAIRSYFKWLKKEGALTYKPNIRSFSQVPVIHQEISKSDLNIMVQNMTSNVLNKQRDLAMFSLVLYCGFKTEEVVAINTEDVDFAAITITLCQSKKCFQAASSEMLVYAKAKARDNFCWELTYAPDADNEKEPFFLNKNHLRISGRSLRRRCLAYLEKSHSYNMRDLRYTYLKNLDRVIELQVPH